MVEGELGGCGPEVELVASATAAVTEEDLLADVDGEAAFGMILRTVTVQRARTTPLVTTNPQRDVVHQFQNRLNRDLGAQGAIVEAGHARLLGVARGE